MARFYDSILRGVGKSRATPETELFVPLPIPGPDFVGKVPTHIATRILDIQYEFSIRPERDSQQSLLDASMLSGQLICDLRPTLIQVVSAVRKNVLGCVTLGELNNLYDKKPGKVFEPIRAFKEPFFVKVIFPTYPPLSDHAPYFNPLDALNEYEGVKLFRLWVTTE